MISLLGLTEWQLKIESSSLDKRELQHRLESKNHLRQTALHNAASSGSQSIVSLLVKLGACTKSLDATGKPPKQL